MKKILLAAAIFGVASAAHAQEAGLQYTHAAVAPDAIAAMAGKYEIKRGNGPSCTITFLAENQDAAGEAKDHYKTEMTPAELACFDKNFQDLGIYGATLLWNVQHGGRVALYRRTPTGDDVFPHFLPARSEKGVYVRTVKNVKVTVTSQFKRPRDIE